MRNKFADAIYKIGKNDDRICAIVADISPAGSMINFREEFPDRFINVVGLRSMMDLPLNFTLDTSACLSNANFPSNSFAKDSTTLNPIL